MSANLAGVVLLILHKAAERGEPCPTNDALMERCGVQSHGHLHKAIKRLRDSGDIVAEVNGGNRRFFVRHSGKWTGWTAGDPRGLGENRSYRKPAPDARHSDQVKQRICLMCSEPFESHHFGERVCGRCKDTERWQGAA